MRTALKVLSIGLVVSVVLDLGIAWAWLSMHDGPEFPY